MARTTTAAAKATTAAPTTAKSRMWKDGTRRGIVYVEERVAAEKVIAALRPATVATPPQAGRSAPRRRTAALVPSPAEQELGGPAMAVYLDRRGKPFAWQIPFPLDAWDRVTALVNAE